MINTNTEKLYRGAITYTTPDRANLLEMSHVKEGGDDRTASAHFALEFMSREGDPRIDATTTPELAARHLLLEIVAKEVQWECGDREGDAPNHGVLAALISELICTSQTNWIAYVSQSQGGYNVEFKECTDAVFDGYITGAKQAIDLDRAESKEAA
jgi:hypothetical protein